MRARVKDREKTNGIDIERRKMVKKTTEKINNNINNIKLNDIVFTLSQLVNECKCKKNVVRRDYCRNRKTPKLNTEVSNIAYAINSDHFFPRRYL